MVQVFSMSAGYKLDLVGYHQHKKLGSIKEKGVLRCNREVGRTETGLLSLTDHPRPTEG